MMHEIFLCDFPIAAAILDLGADCRGLFLVELRLSARRFAVAPGFTALSLGTLADTDALFLGDDAEKAKESLTVENDDGGTGSVHARHQRDTVHHRAGGAVPFGDNEHIAGRKAGNGPVKLRAVARGLARSLLGELEITAVVIERGDLPG
jgi:hypothetical protein